MPLLSLPASPHPWRARAAVALLVFAAMTNVRLLRSAWVTPNPIWDSEAALKRFAPVVNDLPAGTEVNYLDAKPSAAGEDFFMARYCLMPLRLVLSPRQWIVVDSRQPVAGYDDRPADVKLVADYGNGLRLFAREATP